MTEKQYTDLVDHVVATERVLACLLDHYLSEYEQNDGERLEGLKDSLCAEAVSLVPNWRTRRDEWKPKS